MRGFAAYASETQGRMAMFDAMGMALPLRATPNARARSWLGRDGGTAISNRGLRIEMRLKLYSAFFKQMCRHVYNSPLLSYSLMLSRSNLHKTPPRGRYVYVIYITFLLHGPL
jgi:hypothetical protein